MKHYVLAVLLAFAAAFAGCAGGLGYTSPEAQIATGANALTGATTLATVALRNNKITVVQAKSYRVMLGAAGQALDDANTTLVKCRADTHTAPGLASDPCQPSVVGMITLALDSIANVKRTLDAAQ